MENAIYTINAYKRGSTWFFDDASRDIKLEPFVQGASEIITSLVGKRKRKAILMFSETPIPSPDLVLTNTEKCYPMMATGEFNIVKGKKIPKYIEDVNAEPISGWYVDEKGNECWLCPAQVKFFNRVADVIYVKQL